MWSVKCSVRSVECKVWSVECAVGKVWSVAGGGDLVVLVMLLCWWCCCVGDFVLISLRWWYCCAGCDFVVLVVMLLCWLVVSLWTARCMQTKVRFPIAEVCTRSPRTWIHSGSWLPSCCFFCFLFFWFLVFWFMMVVCWRGWLFASSPTLVFANLLLVHFLICFGPVVPLANNVNYYGKMQVPLDM